MRHFKKLGLGKATSGNLLIIISLTIAILSSLFIVMGQGLGAYRKIKLRADSKQMAGDIEPALLQMVAHQFHKTVEKPWQANNTAFITDFNTGAQIPGLGQFFIPVAIPDYPVFDAFPQAEAGLARCRANPVLRPTHETESKAYYLCVSFKSAQGGDSRVMRDDSSLESFFESSALAEFRITLVDLKKSEEVQNTTNETTSVYKTRPDSEVGLRIFYSLYWTRRGDDRAKFTKMGTKLITKKQAIGN